MVKTRNPLSSEAASGKLGQQIVFKPRGQVQTAARRTDPGNPRSARQQVVRAAFAQTAALWSSLSPAQAAQWEAYAEENPRENNMGQLVTISGFDAFCECSRPFVEKFGTAPLVPIAANAGRQITDVQWVRLMPRAWECQVVLNSPLAGFKLIAVWRQGPLANRNRALRQPEQRWDHTSNTAGMVDGISVSSGPDWWYFGVRVCPPGAFPTLLYWAGPFDSIA